MPTSSTFIPSLFPPMVSRAGWMSSASSHSGSRLVEILAHRSRVLSRPSGDSVSVAVVPLTSALGDSGTTDALVAIWSFFIVNSTMTTRQLVEVIQNYFIPPEYEIHVPLSGERPYDAFPCGFGLSTDALEAGLGFPLHLLPDRVDLSDGEQLRIGIVNRRNQTGRDPPRDPFHFKGVKDMNEAWLAKASLNPALGEMFNLGKMKSRGGVDSGSATLSAASAPAARDAGVSTVEKRPSSGAEAGLRKRLPKVATEQPANASGSTARTSTDKDKGTMELEEVPERGYTMRELCEVEDQAGADRYFTSIMTRLKCVYGEDPLVPRWLTISGSSLFWTEGPLSSEYLRGALHPTLAKQVYECSSKELMNRAGKSVVWGLHFVSILIDRVHDAGRLVRSQHKKILALRAVNKELKAKAEIERMRAELESYRSQWRELEQEVRFLRSSLDGAQDDRARLEGDVLSLTEAIAFLEAELKDEGQKAVAAYKASQGFESSLEKMGRVSYEFGYRVALERLRGKHLDIMIELDPFVECSEDTNVKMDLDQPFDDGTPFEKQLTM
ncbi:hypothetical protein BHM03_00008684 [Ensete ventricosum]|uniref:Uncharacterized protein n=1 Tax=Ensete ventricosum TaxID=4639 RepID=A0A445MCC5_ENSVE|nr:hypothetical protein BHM03_00008684 [Ensete ventricosum]